MKPLLYKINLIAPSNILPVIEYTNRPIHQGKQYSINTTVHHDYRLELPLARTTLNEIMYFEETLQCS